MDIATLLTLTCRDTDQFRSLENDENLRGEIFGGQYLGQALWAAMKTAADRVPHALQCFFLHSASASRPLDFTVERTRDGRSFSHRRVTASQDGKEVFRAEISLTVPQDGQADHQLPMPTVPAAETFPLLQHLIQDHADLVGTWAVKKLSKITKCEIRPVHPNVGITEKASEPKGLFWIKAVKAENTGTALQYSTLAYLTDVMANYACRAVHAANVYDGSLASLSLNHGVWFHRCPNVDDWLLFALDSPSSSFGLGFNRGLIYGADGTLYASTVQDALIRYS